MHLNEKGALHVVMQYTLALNWTTVIRQINDNTPGGQKNLLLQAYRFIEMVAHKASRQQSKSDSYLVSSYRLSLYLSDAGTRHYSFRLI